MKQHSRLSIGPALIGASTLLAALILAIPGTSLLGSGIASANQEFSYNSVIDLAQELSKNPYVEAAPLPEPFSPLDYDAWRDIRFDPEKSLWRKQKLPFEVQLFHPGFLYQNTVSINIVDNGKAEELPVEKSMFTYGRNRTLGEQLPEVIGAAGFRIHAPINTRKYFDEFLVFLGASYFRAVGKGQNYGISARGLAVDTALPKGEEFPWFRKFWIVKPNRKDKDLVIYALLDSQSLTGAYAFRVWPGTTTQVDVAARIFLRNPVEKLGFAPLTSMFFYGENSLPSPRMGWRPEVHDSDGLLVNLANGEWLWRPLQNLRTLQLSSFEANDVQGFGVLQRDRNFHDYEDLEAHYEQRPSVWIEPIGAWGNGHMELVQIPSDQEIHDNIVAYWTPDTLPTDDQPLAFEYRMRWMGDPAELSPGGYVTSTRVGRVHKQEDAKEEQDGEVYIFVVDFGGETLAKIDPDEEELSANVDVGQGAELLEQQVFPNPETKGWRLSFKVRFASKSTLERMLPDKEGPIELRAFLRHKDDVLSETWSYTFKPELQE
ncbi:glucan biosynthesis protein G [Oceanidesulfovibrio marinus]|uniref:Glucan biosynthesis protein D n=1 Tax=Oceanidesulfovibrio marinus TaxID=370038 RepID=A0A6P1ZII5_9BACT|nr:glucan biosynthesis protein G [Oceanidesulfovibrio marinus]QJT07479.1 glucan biosynthesis protein G [Oceanidesulfovibrio marinus]TVM34608.1 glucan biosynthesis protein D [Oceanidesulfovibrio marinus]